MRPAERRAAGLGVAAVEAAFLTAATAPGALVLGGPTIDDPLVKLVTSVEAFLGAFFIALFVFTLTRSIRR